MKRLVIKRVLDESVVTDALIVNWKDNDRAMRYLNVRFPGPHYTGDFLKAIVKQKIKSDK